MQIFKNSNYLDNNSVDKEFLTDVAHKNRLTKNELLLEILDNFEISIARQKNKSFEYFVNIMNEKFSDYISWSIE